MYISAVGPTWAYPSPPSAWLLKYQEFYGFADGFFFVCKTSHNRYSSSQDIKLAAVTTVSQLLNASKANFPERKDNSINT